MSEPNEEGQDNPISPAGFQAPERPEEMKATEAPAGGGVSDASAPSPSDTNVSAPGTPPGYTGPRIFIGGQEMNPTTGLPLDYKPPQVEAQGGWGASDAQRAVQRHNTAGRIPPSHVVEQAQRDGEAQKAGLPFDPEIGGQRYKQLWDTASQTVGLPMNDPHRGQAIATMFNHLVTAENTSNRTRFNAAIANHEKLNQIREKKQKEEQEKRGLFEKRFDTEYGTLKKDKDAWEKDRQKLTKEHEKPIDHKAGETDDDYEGRQHAHKKAAYEALKDHLDNAPAHFQSDAAMQQEALKIAIGKHTLFHGEPPPGLKAMQQQKPAAAPARAAAPQAPARPTPAEQQAALARLHGLNATRDAASKATAFSR